MNESPSHSNGVTSREPNQAEMDILRAGFERNLANFRKNPDAAMKLVSIGSAPRDPRLDVPELAAYTITSSIILNLDEAVTRQIISFLAAARRAELMLSTGRQIGPAGRR